MLATYLTHACAGAVATQVGQGTVQAIFLRQSALVAQQAPRSIHRQRAFTREAVLIAGFLRRRASPVSITNTASC
eukprot:6183287-Pleurochrysis_carterae.AAC.2